MGLEIWKFYVYLQNYNVLRSSGISQKSGALIVRYSQKKEYISCVFYCFENLSIAITLEQQVRIRWGFQQNVSLLTRTSIEKWKCHMFAFRLIPLDRITYVINSMLGSLRNTQYYMCMCSTTEYQSQVFYYARPWVVYSQRYILMEVGVWSTVRQVHLSDFCVLFLVSIWYFTTFIVKL